MSKNACLSLLVCLNLVLLTALALAAYSPPQALAQGTGLAGNYLVVTGEIQNEYDGLYIVDLRDRTLHGFYFDRGTKKLRYSGFRDLESDFRNP
ncbi:MAG: hypothetical protein KKB50_05235 [Planctomycetes bacterium]|nr:hypothetical protein [Planctomycetota bacterium]